MAGAGVFADGTVMHQGPSVQCVMQWGCWRGGGLVADLKKENLEFLVDGGGADLVWGNTNSL